MSCANDLFRELLKRGLSNMYIEENSEELRQKYHDPNKDIKPYLLATFGSAWAVVVVKINNQELIIKFISETVTGTQNLFTEACSHR